MSLRWFGLGLLVGFGAAVYFLLLWLPPLWRVSPIKRTRASDEPSFWIGFAIGLVLFGALLYFAAVDDAAPSQR